MLSLTRKADYALIAMAELARSMPNRLSARVIAERVGVPLPMLSNILNQLLNSGLISSQRGPQGGYALVRPANDISLAAMIDAIDGPIMLARCCQEEVAVDDDRCDLEDSCQIKEPIRRVHESFRQFLSGVSLSYVAFGTVPLSLDTILMAGSPNVASGEQALEVSQRQSCGQPIS